jgi:hypothetical protein
MRAALLADTHFAGKRYGIRTRIIALAVGDTAANHHHPGDYYAPLGERGEFRHANARALARAFACRN